MHNGATWWLATIAIGLGILGWVIGDQLRELNDNVKKIEQRTQFLDLPIFPRVKPDAQD